MPGSSPRLTPVPFTHVTLSGGLLAERQATNRQATIPAIHRQLGATGRLELLKMQWQPGDPYTPHFFWDSDVAKWLEGACYSLATHPDPALEAQVEAAVALLVAAQQPDGYLNTYFTRFTPEARWTNLRDQHELYCAGHLMEAAVAHYETTGRRTLLDALCRYADTIATVFGPGPDQKHGYPGHEEIELGLVKLYRATGEARYLELSRYFIDERGRQPLYFDTEALARGDDPAAYFFGSHAYSQSHLPVREQTEAVGHAVRAVYLYSAMADVATATGDASLLAACERLFESIVNHKLYLTGGIGAAHHGESFGRPDQLPNDSAYAETCAAIGLIFFVQRMLQLEGDGRYADVLERALYNNVLAGMSQDGTRFFYVNPLEADGTHHRQDFFTCACCPPNVTRLLASLGQYVASTTPDGLAVHLYTAATIDTAVAGMPVRLTQQTDYPWDGTIALTVDPAQAADFELRLRIPGWCAAHRLTVNGEPVRAPEVKGYAVLRRTWQPGDTVELVLEMPIERIVADPRVAADAGRVALQRGPLVYCVEQADHGQTPATSLILPDDAPLTARFDPDLLGGVVVLEGEALAPDWADGRERLYGRASQIVETPVALRAIPYYAWDNRTPGPMAVWITRRG